MIGHRNLLAFSTMVSLDEATPLFEHQIMSKQSFNYYMRPQDRDEHHHAPRRKGKGRSLLHVTPIARSGVEDVHATLIGEIMTIMIGT